MEAAASAVARLGEEPVARVLVKDRDAFAALYEVTPLKDVCLAKCRSPIGFLLGSWRDGRLGALQMGWRHGG